MAGISLVRNSLPATNVAGAFARASVRVSGTPVPAAAATSDARVALRSASAALRDALASASRISAATLNARRPTLTGRASMLTATADVNSQTSTIRMSAMGLGLDTTSPQGPSRLTSTMSIGIDGTTAQAASVLSSSAILGLDVATPEAASTITSTAEANTMSTSYGVVQATFSAGTSVGTLSGTYAGTGAASNATALTLTMTSTSGTIGSLVPKLVSINVKDQNNTNLGTYSAWITTGGTISLGADIGLSISFGAGSVTQNATSTFTVSNTTPTDVDATAAFNAGVNVRPRFDGSKVVTAGSFTVNGTSVSVLANDSINSVLSRINSTVSGVTASFSGDKVTLQSTAASEDAITLAGDTSGFLSALNLTGATTVTGNVRDDLQTLAKTSQFGAVVNGAFTVNGANISVNRTTDTLQSIIGRINSAGAGVTATYDSAADKIRLTTTTNSESDIVVAGDTSGFLTAGKLSTGNTVRGNIHDDKQAMATVTQFAGVTAGSFTINGVSIGVNPAVDTLQALISAINASAAGVAASYDANTNKVTLTTTANSEDDIVVAGDTTGLVAALKLGAATTVKGNVADDVQKLDKTTRFAGVGNGSFSVNGQSIAVNGATDTLQTVISRINAAGAGVTASYDATTNKVVFTPTTAGATLVIENDTSGFLAGAAIAAGAQGTRVNAATAFNGTGMNSPLFDAGLSVGAGAFTVNGVAIAVAATDTLTTVLDRITASQAGVTATYDATTDRVRLVAKKMDATPITLGADTSGFLAAVKLDGTHLSSLGKLGGSIDAQARPSALASAVTEPVGAALADLNRTLERLSSERLSADFRTSIMNAVRGAVSSVSNGPASGLKLALVDGKEELVVDMAALAESLANDPEALAALVLGPQGLPEAFNVALADEAEAALVGTPSAAPPEESLGTADIVRAAGAALMQRVTPFLAPPPVASLARVDLLV